jgi:hypothetical protein
MNKNYLIILFFDMACPLYIKSHERMFSKTLKITNFALRHTIVSMHTWVHKNTVDIYYTEEHVPLYKRQGAHFESNTCLWLI